MYAAAYMLSAALCAYPFDGYFLNAARGFGVLPVEEGRGAFRNTGPAPAVFGLDIPELPDEFNLRIRYADLHSDGRRHDATDASGRRVRLRPEGFSVCLCGVKDTLEFRLRGAEREVNGIERGPTVEVIVRLRGETLDSVVFTENVALAPHENMFVLRYREKSVGYMLGSSKRGEIHEVSLSLPGCGDDYLPGKITGIRIVVPPAGALLLDELTVLPADRRAIFFDAVADTDSYTDDELDSPENRDSGLSFPLEGRWKIYDYDYDDTLVTLPVDYEFRLVGRRESGGVAYDLVYLGGGSGQMRRGDVKATLMPSGFPGVWDVEWLTADGRLLRKGIRASSEHPLLTFRFALQSASFRLRCVE